jgi:hypothetical protein
MKYKTSCASRQAASNLNDRERFTAFYGLGGPGSTIEGGCGFGGPGSAIAAICTATTASNKIKTCFIAMKLNYSASLSIAM